MEVTEYDFGQIIRGANGNLEFKFTNIGNETLIISRVRTGDGGSMAYQKSRQPILPGESGIIVFKYDTKRIGAFHKSIDITYNGKGSKLFRGVRIKGEVILPPTSLSVTESTIDMGSISYGELSTATFSMQNSGDQKLKIHSLFGNYSYVDGDIFSDRVYSPKQENPPKNRYQRDFEPGETVLANVTIRNIYGNTGYFERKLAYKYNSHDTVWLTLTGTFTGAPEKSIVYEKHDALHYENGKLYKRVTYGTQEAIVRIDYFNRSNCIKSERFDGQNGRINQVRTYENGVEKSKKFFKKGQVSY